MLIETADVIKRAGRILILPHIFLDGDALGSSLALSMALKSKSGCEVVICTEEPISFNYAFLPETGLIKQYPLHIGADDSSSGHFDLVITLDTGDIDRLGKRIDYFKKCPLTLNIDHHPTNTLFAGYNTVMPERSAVGEIIFELIHLLDIEITKDMAECLYVAIATDTGGFRFSNTTSLSHIIISELLKTGINVADISFRIFDNMTLKKTIAMGKAVESLEMYFGGAFALMMVDCPADASEEDYDGIVNIGRNIEGVEVAAMIRQKQDKGEIKVNLRSKEYIDVAAIASKFSGGGHIRASGFTVFGDAADVKGKLMEAVKEQLRHKI